MIEGKEVHGFAPLFHSGRVRHNELSRRIHENDTSARSASPDRPLRSYRRERCLRCWRWTSPSMLDRRRFDALLEAGLVGSKVNQSTGAFWEGTSALTAASNPSGVKGFCRKLPVK